MELRENKAKGFVGSRACYGVSQKLQATEGSQAAQSPERKWGQLYLGMGSMKTGNRRPEGPQWFVFPSKKRKKDSYFKMI